MRATDIYVADRRPHDAVVEHPIELSRLHRTFCFKLSRADGQNANVDLDVGCLCSPNVALYTFIEDDRIVDTMDVVWEQVATMYLQFVHRSRDASGACIANQPELRRCIVASCKQQWERNYAHFLQTASLNETDKQTRNIACGKLLKAVLVKAPMRFRTFRYNHTYAIPFRLGDRIHFGCTVQSYIGTQRYDIRLLVKDDGGGCVSSA